MITDGRERGAWRQTPWFLRTFGWPPYRRPIYADWRIGGGFDGWDYRQCTFPFCSCEQPEPLPNRKPDTAIDG
ncbi:hypothetical protein, partial [Mesorhizobium sp. M7A.F.Ca.CA.001.04.1.1]|uniref:hypothetical protein n=1 Tax=Mesorhizobium sp. M7A.F.Ca.CA.001.04.1.1 TaxID=2496714 RepID=UPI0019D2B21D